MPGTVNGRASYENHNWSRHRRFRQTVKDSTALKLGGGLPKPNIGKGVPTNSKTTSDRGHMAGGSFAPLEVVPRLVAGQSLRQSLGGNIFDKLAVDKLTVDPTQSFGVPSFETLPKPIQPIIGIAGPPIGQGGGLFDLSDPFNLGMSKPRPMIFNADGTPQSTLENLKDEFGGSVKGGDLIDAFQGKEPFLKINNPFKGQGPIFQTPQLISSKRILQGINSTQKFLSQDPRKSGDQIAHFLQRGQDQVNAFKAKLQEQRDAGGSFMTHDMSNNILKGVPRDRFGNAKADVNITAPAGGH